MRKISFLLFLLVAFIGSCVDPLNINIDREVNILIVEGSINTLPGPHAIRLTQSAKYGTLFESFIRPLSRAKVSIRDFEGVTYELTESAEGTGVYLTGNDFMAQVGNSYTLLISTATGVEYTSLPEKIIKATKILELKSEFVKTPIENGQFNTGLNVLATIQDDPDAQNFYMWQSNGTYKTETYPENFMARDPNGGPANIPAPKDCCKECWVNSIDDSSIRLLSDNNVNGNLITDVAAYIQDDGYRFTDKYMVRIEQHTLTREAFQFFKLLNDQISISGDIFDPPPATLRGNMINLTNPDENVIGYFRASDVSVDSLFLTTDMLPELKPLLQFNDDCRLLRNGVAERPSYW